MGVASIVFGIIGLFFALIGLIPLLGIVKWIAVPLLVLGLIFGIIGICGKKRSGAAIAGTIICALFLLIGVVRLAVGSKMMADAAKPETIEKLYDTTSDLQDLSNRLNELNNMLNTN